VDSYDAVYCDEKGCSTMVISSMNTHRVDEWERNIREEDVSSSYRIDVLPVDRDFPILGVLRR
jgi:hypothetical protein